jgi:hypothetical protein
MEKIEKGVVVEYAGKYWGLAYDDGNNKSYGWVDIDEAIISDSRFLTKPEELTYINSPFISELQKGKLINVIRVTTVTHIF